MKKKIMFLCLVFFMIPLCLFLFSCSHSLEEQVSCCVSEYRENYFYVKTENFTASFTDGEGKASMSTTAKRRISWIMASLL